MPTCQLGNIAPPPSKDILSNNHCKSWSPSVIMSQSGGLTASLWPIRGKDTVSGQHLASARLLLHHCIIIPDRASQTVPGLSRTFLSSWFLFRFLLNVTTCHQPIRGLAGDLLTNERAPPPTSVFSVTVTVGNAVMTPVTSLHSDLFSSRCLILLWPGGHNSPRYLESVTKDKLWHSKPKQTKISN